MCEAKSLSGHSNLAGIGLKPQHYRDVLNLESQANAPGWLEVHPQNYFGDGGPPHNWLSAISEQFPISFHSVGLSLGSAEGLDRAELEKLAALCGRYSPFLVSDHLSFSGNAHDRFADLLPMPYTHEVLEHFVAQVDTVQQRLGRQMLIENPSAMLAYAHNDMLETEFLAQLVRQTGCGLLLDLNNILVSTGNLGGEPEAWLEGVDPDWVGEIHLAGHSVEQHESGPLHIDDHGSSIGMATWGLFAAFIAKSGPKPTLIEWDNNIPDYATLCTEAQRAKEIMADNASQINTKAEKPEHAFAG